MAFIIEPKVKGMRTAFERSPLYRKLHDHFVENGGDRALPPADLERIVHMLVPQNLSEAEARAVIAVVQHELLPANAGRLATVFASLPNKLRLWHKVNKRTPEEQRTMPKLPRLANIVAEAKELEAAWLRAVKRKTGSR